MKNIIIIGDPDYARIRAHLPDHSVVLHDLWSGLPCDLYGAHVRLSAASEDFEVLDIRNGREETPFESAVLSIARYFNRKITIV